MIMLIRKKGGVERYYFNYLTSAVRFHQKMGHNLYFCHAGGPEAGIQYLRDFEEPDSGQRRIATDFSRKSSLLQLAEPRLLAGVTTSLTNTCDHYCPK